MICNRMIPLWLKWSRFGYKNWVTSSRNSCFQCSRYWKKKFLEEFLFHKNILAFAIVTWTPHRSDLLQVMKAELPRGIPVSKEVFSLFERNLSTSSIYPAPGIEKINSSRKFCFHHLEQGTSTRWSSYLRKG